MTNPSNENVGSILRVSNHRWHVGICDTVCDCIVALGAGGMLMKFWLWATIPYRIIVGTWRTYRELESQFSLFEDGNDSSRQ